MLCNMKACVNKLILYIAKVCCSIYTEKRYNKIGYNIKKVIIYYLLALILLSQ
jgi:hypothetical protein